MKSEGSKMREVMGGLDWMFDSYNIYIYIVKLETQQVAAATPVLPLI